MGGVRGRRPSARGAYPLAEWEYAARAGTTTRYYWGDEVGTGWAYCKGCTADWVEGRTSPVGRYPPNAFGLYDMLGNVSEIVEDCWHDDYVGPPNHQWPWTMTPCYGRPARGGSYASLAGTSDVRSASRFWLLGDLGGRDVGFRVARELQ